MKILTAKEVAQRLNVCYKTARQIMKSPLFPRIQGTGRLLVEESAFNKWLKREEYTIEKR